MTGEVGDMVIVHPYILHRASPNPSHRPRFIANSALVMERPMCFERVPGDPYSLVELAVLRALGVNRLHVETQRPMLTVTPGPFRKEGEAAEQQGLLDAEMREMADRGLVTPAWAGEFGYTSNDTSSMRAG